MARLKNSTVSIFILWLIIVPPGVIYIIKNHFPQGVHWFYLVIFMLFGFLTVLFPITMNGKPILLAAWITIPAFLLFGLLVEVILMQVSILGMLFYSKNQTHRKIDFFVNSLLFFILSIAAAAAFHLAGGVVGSLEFWPMIIAVSVYQIVHRLLYDFAKFNINRVKGRGTYFTKDLLLESATVIIILPFALMLYFLVEYIGFGAFLLLGIPFFFIVITLRLYNNTEKVNDDLQLAGSIGHELSNHLSEESVINQFIKKVSEMFKADFTYLFDHKSEWLELLRSYEKGAFKNIDLSRFSIGEGIAGTVLKENKPVIYAKREEWLNLSKDYTPDAMQSIMVMPISRNQKIEGVIFISSMKKNVYTDYQLKILDILCSYFTVSVEKARYVEETVRKSERCGLTHLYNYIYLEERLAFEKTRLQHGNLKELSVVMIDIDHFKHINDTYGHQSGNDILIKLSEILEKYTPENGIVGRYGGEEFIYILPGMAKEDTIDFAEGLRKKIETYQFEIFPDLGASKAPIAVTITVSIGVSAIPEDTGDVNALLRNADRALYLGAKRAGRNRVAGYVK
ncbi:sensor domain-containing diguanylate cyclase [Sporosarcina ureilytica]|uniref:GGDEF domain-containing protein n=1 Tax=Sporosarcina ureilytica TaxID=298596 RepID=A0A1D8JFW1_9BACL|nr:sensor domain-containing diguanylate cyclase [Sporosarcina ureilytica]AOV07594.1 hypothetical protein BI350_08640 [Sporosarcina ureilytica]